MVVALLARMMIMGVLIIIAEACTIALDRDPNVTSANLRTYITTNGLCASNNLDILSITNINLTTILNTTFSGLTALVNLSIVNCSLTTLPDYVFASLTALTYLSLRNNALSSFAPSAFYGMNSTNSLTINLNNNQLTSLTSGQFVQCRKLSFASFSNNRLSLLEAGVFNASSLTRLDLSSNNFTSFGTTVFQGLSSLTQLNLNSNRISVLQEYIFSGPNLATLNITNNSLTTLPAYLCGGALSTFPSNLAMDSPPGCPPLSGGGCTICPGLGCYYMPSAPTTAMPTRVPTTAAPTRTPTTSTPTTLAPTIAPTTAAPTMTPTTPAPTTATPTEQPTGPTMSPTAGPTTSPTTGSPSTVSPTTRSPTSSSPTTALPTTALPTTTSPTTRTPTTTTPTITQPLPFGTGQRSSSPAPADPNLALYISLPLTALVVGCLLLLWWWCRKRASFAANKSRAAEQEEHGVGPQDGSVKQQELVEVRVAPDAGRVAPSTMVDVPAEEVDIGPLLGHGAFGSVSQCLWRGTDYAMKRLLNPAQHALFAKEVEINRQLACHPHIHVTRMVGVISHPAAIVMELYPLGNVEDYLKTHLLTDDVFPQLLTLLITASAGVMHLHSLRIIHRDLAARNFLVKSDLSASICDFGLALPLPEGKPWGQRTKEERAADMLPVNITAPETLMEGIFSPASDVYMFGFFIWEVLTRQTPHAELFLNQRDLKSFLKAVVHEGLRPPLPPGWPSALRLLLAQCWHRNPNNRPTMAQVNEALRHCRREILENKISLVRAAPSKEDAPVGVYYQPVGKDLQEGPYGAWMPEKGGAGGGEKGRASANGGGAHMYGMVGLDLSDRSLPIMGELDDRSIVVASSAAVAAAAASSSSSSSASSSSSSSSSSAAASGGGVVDPDASVSVYGAGVSVYGAGGGCRLYDYGPGGDMSR